MLIPVRCFTCGSLIADKHPEFLKRAAKGEDIATIFEDLGVKKYCCRRMLLTNVDIIDQVIPYYEALYRRRLEFEGS